MNHDYLNIPSAMVEKNLIVFASGAGSNARQIINYFRNKKGIKVALIVCNNPKAGVLEIAAAEKIPVMLINKEKFLSDAFLDELDNYRPALIVLAGFLWKIPENMVKKFAGKIINLHPALLPAYGGKGMYGPNVHNAVINAKEKESGITIHFVDEKYDHGQIIFQGKCSLEENETAESLAQKIHKLEHAHFPPTIESILNDIDGR